MDYHELQKMVDGIFDEMHDLPVHDFSASIIMLTEMYATKHEINPRKLMSVALQCMYDVDGIIGDMSTELVKPWM